MHSWSDGINEYDAAATGKIGSEFLLRKDPDNSVIDRQPQQSIRSGSELNLKLHGLDRAWKINCHRETGDLSLRRSSHQACAEGCRFHVNAVAAIKNRVRTGRREFGAGEWCFDGPGDRGRMETRTATVD